MTALGSGAVVVLIGPPSAGKSSVGALLAAELGVPFADTDDLVAAAAGKPVGDIFVDEGEPVFRELRNYSGWVILEAELDPRIADPLTYASLGYKNLRRLLSQNMQ